MKTAPNLIGISGRIGSGKDTVCQIIQGLTLGKSFLDIEKSLENRFFDSYISDWKVVRFAGVLKQFVSLLTGISLTDLESQQVKDSYLPEIWNRWFFTHTNGNIEKVPFHYYDDIESYTRRFQHIMVGSPYEVRMKVRTLLQELGTNAMRDVIHPEIHINATFVNYKLERNPNSILRSMVYPKWIIPDTRFKNEFKGIKARNGIVIRVNRFLPCTVCNLTLSERRGSICSDITCPSGRLTHPSETELDDAEFDYVLDNNGDIQNLINEVYIMLQEIKLI